MPFRYYLLGLDAQISMHHCLFYLFIKFISNSPDSQNINRISRIWFYFFADFIYISNNIPAVRKIVFSPNLVIYLLFTEYLPLYSSLTVPKCQILYSSWKFLPYVGITGALKKQSPAH